MSEKPSTKHAPKADDAHTGGVHHAHLANGVVGHHEQNPGQKPDASTEKPSEEGGDGSGRDDQDAHSTGY